MKTIHKYWIEGALDMIEMPAEAQILAVGYQVRIDGPCPCLWALVDLNAAAKELRYFAAIPTGSIIQQEPRASIAYVGTIRIPTDGRVSGEAVWHVFEAIKADHIEGSVHEGGSTGVDRTMADGDGLGTPGRRQTTGD